MYVYLPLQHSLLYAIKHSVFEFISFIPHVITDQSEHYMGHFEPDLTLIRQNVPHVATEVETCYVFSKCTEYDLYS